jgi:hypothetical protein
MAKQPLNVKERTAAAAGTGATAATDNSAAAAHGCDICFKDAVQASSCSELQHPKDGHQEGTSPNEHGMMLLFNVQAEVQSVSSATPINQWADKVTNGLIPQVVSPSLNFNMVGAKCPTTACLRLGKASGSISTCHTHRHPCDVQ